MKPSNIVDILFANKLALRIGELNDEGEQGAPISLSQIGIEGIIGPPEGRAIGNPGDVRIRLDGGEIWQKVTGLRSKEGWQLRGAVGPKGDPGAQGAQGTQGPAGASGSLALSLRNVPSGAASRVNLGIPTTVTGTLAAPVPTSTNLLTSLTRTQAFGGAVPAAGLIAGWRSEIALFWRGNAPDLGGFEMRWRWALTAFASGFRAFTGYLAQTVIPTTEPTGLVNVIGMGFDTDSSQWSIIHSDEVGPATVIPLGAAFNVNTTHALSLQLNADPNGTEVEYIATNLSTGVVESDVITSNLPPDDVFLSQHEWVNSGSDATTIPRIDLMDIVYAPPA